MKCKGCDLENPESASFCKRCGTRLESKNETIANNYRTLETNNSISYQGIIKTEEKNKNNFRKRFFAYIIDYFFVMGLFEFINSWVIIRYGPRFVFSTLNLMFFIYFLIMEFKFKNTIGKIFINVITIGKDPNAKPNAIATILLSLIKSIPILLFIDVLFGIFIKRMDGKFLRVSEKLLKVSCENILEE